MMMLNFKVEAEAPVFWNALRDKIGVVPNLSFSASTKDFELSFGEKAGVQYIEGEYTLKIKKAEVTFFASEQRPKGLKLEPYKTIGTNLTLKF
ncbi:MAG: hypothetical protein AB1468_03755 [Candidatus Micrarchaeota archaeon]